MSRPADSCHGLALLRQRCEAIAPGFERVMACALPTLDVLAPQRRVAFAGVGMSEGAARYTMALWSNVLGADVRYLWPSRFLDPEPLARQGEALVLFTQGLSPHARLLMSRQGEFSSSVLVTSHQGQGCPALERWRAAHGDCFVLPPEEPEDQLLLRVLGPAWAMLGALRWTQRLATAQASAQAPWALDAGALSVSYQASFERGLVLGQALIEQRHMLALDAGRDAPRPLVLLSAGLTLELSHGLRWKCLEALWIAVPPLLDVLSFVHGALQGIYDTPATIIFLRQESPHHEELSKRLSLVLKPHHTLIELTSSLASPLAVLDYDAQLNGILCAALSQTDRDLTCWPAKGEDGPLYELETAQARAD